MISLPVRAVPLRFDSLDRAVLAFKTLSYLQALGQLPGVRLEVNPSTPNQFWLIAQTEAEAQRALEMAR